MATADVSSCSVFLFWYVKGHRENLRPFCYFRCIPQRLLIITESKACFSSMYEVKVCSPLYNLLYQFSQFPVSMEHLKLRKQKNGGIAIDGPPQGSMNGPVDHSWSSAFCYKLPVMYKVFHLLFKC